MIRQVVRGGVLVGLFMLVAAGQVSAEPMNAGKAFTKLIRGAVNTVTGWVEVPKRVLETTESSGPASGFTWGLLRGFGHGFIRTAAGLYEVFTFPFPAPAGYASIMEPEYVFSTAAGASDDYNY